MVRFAAIVPSRDRGTCIRAKPRRGRLGKVLICIVLMCILAGSSPSLAQRIGGERPPPRPKQSTNPLPWFVGFILLGLAWFPAFKNSKRELERYREENQGPLVKRAGELFGILTQQSFSGLQTDFNEKDEPVLKGIRPDSNPVSVDGMSDGTLDQLYLSLRIAGIEKYLEVNEPIPFIVDDILIKFDEARARATFQVFLELSHKTQIIFFTHNIHLLDVASNVFKKNNLIIHELRK